MVRGNCDYIFLQPIYNKTQRDILWDLEAAFMDRNDFSTLMDQVIERENLPGNSASEPKKKVRIMVCCDFEDSCNPQEKVFFICCLSMLATATSFLFVLLPFSSSLVCTMCKVRLVFYGEF